MMPEMPLVAVVVGAGDMGARHARHWQTAGARVVAIVDPDGARAAAAAAETGATAAVSLEAALAFEPTVVSVCTPTFLHAPTTIAALSAGAHVLCEKPVALTLADAHAMAAAAERHDRRLRFGFMRRFDPAFATLAEQTNAIGGPRFVQANVTAGVRPKTLMHDARANGGPILDMACHLFDMWATWFGGPPTTVDARGGILGGDKPQLAAIQERAIDTALIGLTYPDGTHVQLQMSWGLPAGVPAEEHHVIVGPDALLRVEWPSLIVRRRALEAETWTNPGGDPWQAEIASFAAALRGGGPDHLADATAGIDALRTSLAVLRSIRTGAPVVVGDVLTDDVAPQTVAAVRPVVEARP